MQLNLKNPVVFFDLETTGINITHDRIVEISFVKVHPNGKEEIKSRRINPEMPIPPQATAIHGITDDDVKIVPPSGRWPVHSPISWRVATWQASTQAVSTCPCWRRSFCAPVWIST